MAQIDSSSMSGLLQSLNAVVDAAGFSTETHQKLIALVQGRQEDSEMGAPAAATYKSQSGGIVDVLEDLKEKAEAELAEARKAESSTKHNFNLMKQSLEDSCTFGACKKSRCIVTSYMALLGRNIYSIQQMFLA